MKTRKQLTEDIAPIRVPVFMFDERLAHTFLCIAGESATYGRKIAKILGIKPPTVNDYIRALEKMGLIKKGKRGQEQNYEVDWNNFFDFLSKLIENDFKLIEKNLSKHIFKSEIKINFKSQFDKLIKHLPKSLIIKFYKKYGSQINQILNSKEACISLYEIHYPFFNSIYHLSLRNEKALKNFFSKSWESLKVYSYLVNLQLEENIAIRILEDELLKEGVKLKSA